MVKSVLEEFSIISSDSVEEVDVSFSPVVNCPVTVVRTIVEPLEEE